MYTYLYTWFLLVGFVLDRVHFKKIVHLVKNVDKIFMTKLKYFRVYVIWKDTLTQILSNANIPAKILPHPKSAKI